MQQTETLKFGSHFIAIVILFFKIILFFNHFFSTYLYTGLIYWTYLKYFSNLLPTEIPLNFLMVTLYC